MAHKTKSQKLRQRQSVTVWYPKSNDLVLPDVPASERAEIRKILTWLDGNFPVQAGTCWKTAQALALVAKDPRVQYVEGVYYLAESALDGPMSKPYPHAWNVVNGYCVDLLTEFHNWRFGGKDKWLHEPLKVYSLEDIPVGGVDGCIFQKESENCGGFEHMTKGEICQHVFREATDRLVQKVGATENGALVLRRGDEMIKEQEEFERLVGKWCDYYFNKYGKDELPKSAEGRGCDVAAFIESLTYSNRTPDKTRPA